ncbi:MAG TPA: porin family protein [Cytophagales bacterium]
MKKTLISRFPEGRLALPSLLAALLLLSIRAGLAQELVTAGPKAGVNLSTLAGKDADNATVAPRFVGGLFVSVKPSRRLGLQAEVNYNQKGAKVRTGILTTTQLQLAYVEVPVLARFVFAGRAASRALPYLSTGPSFNVLLNARNAALREPVVTPQYQRFDFGWSAGGGLEIDLENKWWIIDLRYTRGLMNLANQAKPPAVQNAVFSLNMALGFELYDRFGNRRR